MAELFEEIMTPPKNVIADAKETVVEYPTRFFDWIVSEIRWNFRVVGSSCDRFYWDNGFSKAASLAYTALLSLFPFSALAFGLLFSFGAFNDLISPENVQRYLFGQFIPSKEVVTQLLTQLHNFNEGISGLKVNTTVVAFFVVTSILLINSIEYTLNETWQVYEPRTIPQRIAIFCAIILIGPFLFVSAFYFAKLRVEPMLSGIIAAPYLILLYNYLLPFLIDFTAFMLLYYMVPKAPVKFSSSIFGAFVAALLFAIAKAGFALYVERYASYSLYGVVATIPIFLFWLYLAWLIILFGAEASYQAQYLPRTGKIWKRSVLTVGDARMVLAVQALILISRAFLDGKKVPNDLEIAETLGCSSVVLKPTLDTLERAQIISRGDSREMPLTLMKSPLKITLAEIRDALFAGRESMHFPEQVAATFRHFTSQAKAERVTLADIVKEKGDG